MSVATGAGGALTMTLKPTTVGGIKLQLPEPLTGTESSEARAFTYHSTVTILEQHSLLSRAQMISSLGDTIGYPVVGEQASVEWNDVFHEQWKNPSNYEVISFHRKTGVRMADATTAGDGMVLLPIGDDAHPLAALARRPENIHFAHVKVGLDFDLLVKEDERPCHVPIKFFVRLPQHTVQVMNGANNVVAHTSYIGPDDIRTISSEDFLQDVLLETGQLVPFDLTDPAYGRTSADVDESKLNAGFVEKILDAAWPTIKDAFFMVTCPNTVNKPSAALEAITQDYTDALGNTITLSVQVYFQRVCQAIRAMGQSFSYCAVAHFVSNLSPRIKKEVEAGWQGHQGTLARDSVSQMKLLRQAQVEATKAEATIGNIQDIMREQTSLSLLANGFYSPTASNASASAHSSQAETTLKSHSGDVFCPGCTPGWEPGSCFGCLNRSCVWKVGQSVNCPRQNEPGVKECSAINQKAFWEYMDARGPHSRSGR